MNKMKKIGIVSTIIFLLFSIVCISWYAFLKSFGKVKVVSTTFEIGLQSTVDGNSKYFMEVNSYDNCFEIKFNYLLDENREHFFSQGLQYYSETDNVSIIKSSKLETTDFSENFWGWETYHRVEKNYYKHSVRTERINYMSSNDYIDTLISTNPIGNESHFKITLDKDGKNVVYLMKFKGDVLIQADDKFKNWYSMRTYYTDYYNVFDVDTLAGLVYQGISSLSYGTTHACIFEFGDLFEYFEPVDDQNGVWQKVEEKNTDLIIEDIKSYYSIKVTKHEGKIQKASQSLFNCVNGSANFNLTSSDSQDYFFGRTTITVDNIPGKSEVSYVKINDTQVACKLSDKFNNAYFTYADKINLIVLIDLDVLELEGLEFVGFTKDSGLNNYKVISCQTVENIDGELVYSGVTYD